MNGNLLSPTYSNGTRSYSSQMGLNPLLFTALVLYVTDMHLTSSSMQPQKNPHQHQMINHAEPRQLPCQTPPPPLLLPQSPECVQSDSCTITPTYGCTTSLSNISLLLESFDPQLQPRNNRQNDSSASPAAFHIPPRPLEHRVVDRVPMSNVCQLSTASGYLGTSIPSPIFRMEYRIFPSV